MITEVIFEHIHRHNQLNILKLEYLQIQIVKADSE